METHYKKIVEDTDKRVQKALRILEINDFF